MLSTESNEADDRIRVRADGKLRPINIKTQVYPGFPTDLQQPMTAMLASVPGSSYVTETIFENRFRYVDELRRMGANIRVLERTAIVEGVPQLRGTRITATDLRAGAAMIVAALIAEGRSEIKGVKYIMRGYERIDEKLRQLGATAIHKTYADNEYNDDDFCGIDRGAASVSREREPPFLIFFGKQNEAGQPKRAALYRGRGRRLCGDPGKAD